MQKSIKSIFTKSEKNRGLKFTKNLSYAINHGVAVEMDYTRNGTFKKIIKYTFSKTCTNTIKRKDYDKLFVFNSLRIYVCMHEQIVRSIVSQKTMWRIT